MLAWTCPQTLGAPSGHANMLRIFPARRRPRMKEPASGKQSQLDDEIAFRMQVCSFVKIPEKKVKNQLKSRDYFRLVIILKISHLYSSILQGLNIP